MALSFLLTTTDPGSKSLMKAITAEPLYKEHISRRADLAASHPPSPYQILDDFMGFPDPFLGDHTGLSGGELGLSGFDLCLPSIGMDWSSLEARSEKLQNRLSFLIEELHSLHSSLSPHHPRQIPFDIDLAREIFVVENLLTFTSTYFKYVQPEVPILHQPSFDLETVSLELMLVVFIYGSMHVAITDETISARCFSDITEEYVYRQLEVQMAQVEAHGDAGALHEVLQAALMVHSLQYFINDTSAHERDRTKRLPALISALRKLRFTKTKQIPHHDLVDNWEPFIIRETRIR